MPSPGSVRISSLVVCVCGAVGGTQIWIGVRTGKAHIASSCVFNVAVYQIKEDTYDVAFTHNSYPTSSEICYTFPFSYLT